MPPANKKHRQLTVLAALAVTALAGYQAVASDGPPRLGSIAQPGAYRVVSVDDGDTITVDMAGRHERVRLIGLDAPEAHYPDKPPQCFAREATEFVKKLIDNHPVRLAADPLSGNRDRYDRLLRYVYLPDGRLVNAEIIGQGYGFAYLSFPFTKSEQFSRHQHEARQRQLGLWTACRPTPNQYGGWDSNPE